MVTEKLLTPEEVARYKELFEHEMTEVLINFKNELPEISKPSHPYEEIKVDFSGIINIDSDAVDLSSMISVGGHVSSIQFTADIDSYEVPTELLQQFSLPVDELKNVNIGMVAIDTSEYSLVVDEISFAGEMPMFSEILKHNLSLDALPQIGLTELSQDGFKMEIERIDVELSEKLMTLNFNSMNLNNIVSFEINLEACKAYSTTIHKLNYSAKASHPLTLSIEQSDFMLPRSSIGFSDKFELYEINAMPQTVISSPTSGFLFSENIAKGFSLEMPVTSLKSLGDKLSANALQISKFDFINKNVITNILSPIAKVSFDLHHNIFNVNGKNTKVQYPNVDSNKFIAKIDAELVIFQEEYEQTYYEAPEMFDALAVWEEMGGNDALIAEGLMKVF